MEKVKSYDLYDPESPEFSDDYNVLEQVVLNLTNIGGNNNKFYVMELQEHDGDFRIFTHYGRVGATGVKEARYFTKDEQKDEEETPEDIAKKFAEKEFQRILKSKQKKGYVPIDMADSDVGSGRVNGNTPKVKTSKKSDLDVRIQQFVEQIYEEASQSLTQTIRTPLGAISESQIDKGAEKLEQIRKAILYGDDRLLTRLSSEYYSLIPHRFSHRINPAEIIINESDKADREEELLQLMRDVFNVKDELGSGILSKYRAINTDVDPLDRHDSEYDRLIDNVRRSESPHHHVHLHVNNIFRVDIGSVRGRFNPRSLKTRELYHGSANKNILGILQRGLLIAPPCATHTGAAFGRGIYFASHSTKSAQYSTKFYNNKRGNGFLFVADVALGRMQKVRYYTFNDLGPGRGYDSVMGVAGADLIHDEFIVYNVNQVDLKYVIDYTPRSR
jgi:poly [ADP-ribose] polymerase